MECVLNKLNTVVDNSNLEPLYPTFEYTITNTKANPETGYYYNAFGGRKDYTGVYASYPPDIDKSDTWSLSGKGYFGLNGVNKGNSINTKGLTVVNYNIASTDGSTTKFKTTDKYNLSYVLISTRDDLNGFEYTFEELAKLNLAGLHYLGTWIPKGDLLYFKYFKYLKNARYDLHSGNYGNLAYMPDTCAYVYNNDAGDSTSSNYQGNFTFTVEDDMVFDSSRSLFVLDRFTLTVDEINSYFINISKCTRFYNNSSDTLSIRLNTPNLVSYTPSTEAKTAITAIKKLGINVIVNGTNL